MSVLFNLIVLVIFINWFQRNLQKQKTFPIIGIILIFLVASIAAFAFSLIFESDYLDGLQHLLFGGGFILIFWFSTTISIINYHNKKKTRSQIFIDWVQTLPLIIVPIWLWFWISTANFKIGG